MKRFLIACLTFSALIGLNSETYACTTAVISGRASATGRPMLWKQRDTDNLWNHIEHMKGARYAFTGIVNSEDPGRKDIWAGANEVGFAIMNNASYNLTPDSLPNKDLEGVVMKKALGICATIDDFETYILGMELPRGLEANFGVIDAHGGAAYFEVWDLGYTRFDVGDEGYLLRTNFSFSGRQDDGAGYVRYATAQKLFGEHKGKFSAEWIFSTPTRSFYNSLLERDLKDMPDTAFGNGFVVDQDYIARYSTAASIVIEGVNAGENPDRTAIWCTISYPPCSYAIPVWVAAGCAIPKCLSAEGSDHAPASRAAMELKGRVYPVTRGNGNKYLKYVALRRDIAPAVREAEAAEFAAGRKMQKSIEKHGLSADEIERFNADVDSRFEAYCRKMGVEL